MRECVTIQLLRELLLFIERLSYNKTRCRPNIELMLAHRLPGCFNVTATLEAGIENRLYPANQCWFNVGPAS